VAHRFDTMSVGIEHEGAEIIGVVLRSQARRAVISSARGERCRVKGTHGGAVGCAKTEMYAGNGRLHAASRVMMNSTPSEPGAAP